MNGLACPRHCRIGGRGAVTRHRMRACAPDFPLHNATANGLACCSFVLTGQGDSGMVWGRRWTVKMFAEVRWFGGFDAGLDFEWGL